MQGELNYGIVNYIMYVITVVSFSPFMLVFACISIAALEIYSDMIRLECGTSMCWIAILVLLFPSYSATPSIPSHGTIFKTEVAGNNISWFISEVNYKLYTLRILRLAPH